VAEWIDAVAADQFPEGGRRLVRAAGLDIALFRAQGQCYALEDSCPHQGASLVVGKVDGTTVTCRAHGLRFDLATGCMRPAAGLQARSFPVRLHDGHVQIDIAPAAD
jgi:3-phenylpropionate/trans-cinnamate dioxygenase ferredoxin subunit